MDLVLPGVPVLAVPLVRVGRSAGLLVALLLVMLRAVTLVALVRAPGSGGTRGAFEPLAARALVTVFLVVLLGRDALLLVALLLVALVFVALALITLLLVALTL